MTELTFVGFLIVASSKANLKPGNALPNDAGLTSCPGEFPATAELSV